MKRAIFGTLWVLSILLLTVSVTFWVRSYFREDFVSYSSNELGGSRSFWSRHGRLTFWSDQYINDGLWRDGTIRSHLGWEIRSTPIQQTLRWPDKNPSWMGFVHAKGTPGRAYYWALAIPWWAIAGVFAIPSAWGAVVIIRRARHREGTCTVCGYDLRASVGRCPECGTEFEREEARRHEGTEAQSEGPGVRQAV